MEISSFNAHTKGTGMFNPWLYVGNVTAFHGGWDALRKFHQTFSTPVNLVQMFAPS